MKFTISLPLGLYIVTALVSAASIPPALQLLTTDSFSEFHPAQNASSLTALPPLSGFDVTYSWFNSVSLPWLEEFVNTMEVVARFAQDPWYALISSMETAISSQVFRSQLRVGIYPLGIRNKYLLAALYKSGLAITTPRFGRFVKLHVTIRVENQLAGWLLYDLKRVEGGKANSTFPSMNGSLTNINSTSASEQFSDPAVASTSGLSAQRSGWARDPEDPRLRIHYTSQGVDLSPSNVFTTFLDAMITAAQHNGNEAGARLTAVSADRHVSMHVSSILLTWTDLKKALMVLWRFVVVDYVNPDHMLWDDISFTIYDGDTFLGQGAIEYSATDAPTASTVAEAR